MIRPARADDADALAELQVRAWRAAYGAYVDARELDARAGERPARWREILAGDHGTWVADSGRLQGFVSIGASRDDDAAPGEGELFAIYVEPNVVGTGVGGALLAAGERELARQHDVISLWTFEANARARAFYERHGWRVDERPHDPGRWGWAASVRYRKDLR